MSLEVNNNYSILLSIILTMVICTSIMGQQEEIIADISSENAQREEIQRYFGYEDLLYRYLTIPYDSSVNANQQGRHVDVGFILFALTPLILLYFLYNKKKWFYGTMVMLIIYISICWRYSFMFNLNYNINGARYNPAVDGIFPNPDVTRADGFLLQYFYKASGYISKPIVSFFDLVTGPKDHVTYPIIFGLFLLLFYLMLNNKRISEKMKAIGIIGSAFGFLWWILGSGIMWYGFLLIPLGYSFLVYGMNWPVQRRKKKIKYANSQKIVRILGISLFAFWICSAYVMRVSNVNPGMQKDHPDTGKMIIHPHLFAFGAGTISSRECIEYSAKNVSLALDRINADSSLILKAGSALTFEINNNHTRIFEDNNLSHFYEIAQKHKTQEAITATLKSYGFNFIIVDLLLPTIDRTPEKTLTKKFKLLLTGFLYENPYIELVATDRVVREVQADGSNKNVMKVFGTKIPVLGSYAVYQIK